MTLSQGAEALGEAAFRDCGALLRRLNHLFSRCHELAEVETLLDCIGGRNIFILAQLLNMYDCYDLFCLMAAEVVEDPMEADVILSDDQQLLHRPEEEVIRSYDSGRILALLQPNKA